MDFYEGETLDNYLQRHHEKLFSQEEILSVIMPIIEGLKVVHAENFLHRDIAPDNIFLRQTKPPILIDFGASRNALGVQSQDISAIVKHGYSPPEQYVSSKSKQDETTDLYAISAVIYKMITGDKPPEATHRQSEAFNGERDPIEDIENIYKDRFTPSFLRTVQRGLSIRQKDRVHQAINEFQKGLMADIEDNDNIEKGEVLTDIINTDDKKKDKKLFLKPIFLIPMAILIILSSFLVSDMLKKQERERIAFEKREAERIAFEKREAERVALEKKREAERVALEKKREAERVALEKKREAERVALEKKREAERVALELKKEAKRLELAKKERERVALELKKETEKLALAKKEAKRVALAKKKKKKKKKEKVVKTKYIQTRDRIVDRRIVDRRRDRRVDRSRNRARDRRRNRSNRNGQNYQNRRYR